MKAGRGRDYQIGTGDSMLTMYAMKRELKLNKKQKSFFAGCAGFSRFVYNHGLSLLKATWDLHNFTRWELIPNLIYKSLYCCLQN